MDSGVVPRGTHHPCCRPGLRFKFGGTPISRSSNFPRTRGVIGMKTSVLAIVLACAALCSAQETAAPQPQTAAPESQIAASDPQTATPQPQTATPQPQTAAPTGDQSSAPTIKDAAEYNAYVGAIQQQDANAKTSALEAFLTQYPNSVMKTNALELLMGTYQQPNKQAEV